MIPFWLFVAVSLWAVLATVFLFFRNPLPVPDHGHRCFAVPNEAAAKVVVGILGKFGGLPERFTFDAGPTHQTLLWDNTTVVIQHDDKVRTMGLPPNAISIVVGTPVHAAEQAADILRMAGFRANVVRNAMPEVADKFALVTSNAFDGWVLAFRRHIVAMGPPPKKRKLI